MKHFYYFLVFLLLCNLSACNGINYSLLDQENFGFTLEHGSHVSTQASVLDDSARNFTSNKLDLVIILDTGSNTESILSSNIFGEQFLDSLSEYDWRVAYTNTSVDKELFTDKGEARKTNSKTPDCGFLASLFGLTVGVYTGSVLLASGGITGLGYCFSNSQKVSTKNNGKFLEFEKEKRKMELEGNYLTKNIPNHQAIFNATMASRDYSWSYDAPVFKKEESSPVLAIATSLSQAHNNDFFRENSRVVYIVVTPQDSKSKIEVATFKQTVQKELKLKRFQLIPVVVPEASGVSSCAITLAEKKVTNPQPAVRLTKLAKGFDSKSLSICSSNLSEELLEQITEPLYPSDILTPVSY